MGPKVVEEYGAREFLFPATEKFAHVLERRERDAQRAYRARDGGQPEYEIEVAKARWADDSGNRDRRQQRADERNHHLQAHENEIAPDNLGIA